MCKYNERGTKVKCKLNYDLLVKAGYKMLPNHSYSENQHDENWYTGLGLIGKVRFPRFHIVKDDSEYFIHYDMKREHSADEGILFSGKEIDNECLRLSKLKR